MQEITDILTAILLLLKIIELLLSLYGKRKRRGRRSLKPKG
jgi:hypothetical protein